MKISKNISQNKIDIQNLLQSFDLQFYELESNGVSFLCAFLEPLTDKKIFSEQVLDKIQQKKLLTPQDIFLKVGFAGAEIIDTLDDVFTQILDGKTVLFVEGYDKCVAIDNKKVESRAITEPPTSAVVKGPREGFTENIRTNLSLLRRRIKSQNLVIEKFVVGRHTKTDVCVCFIDTIADKKIVDSVKSQIEKIDVDGIYDSSYIAKYITKHKASLFKQVGNTEKPDVFTAKLLEGRVGIIVDGSPIAITVPYLLIEDFQSSEDYFQDTYHANMSRVIRVLSIAFAILLPSLFVAAQLFHLQVIPLNFLLTIVNSIKGIPLSPSFEMFFTLLIFEILNEASIRMPKYLGMALSVVGTLVLGDTAVKAGIVSTPTVMIMALSGIALYTVPELVDSMSFLRLVYLLVAGSVGGYGIILLTCLIVIYLSALENFDVAFLAPFSPFVKSDLKDSAYMTFITNMKNRPISIKAKNRRRMK